MGIRGLAKFLQDAAPKAVREVKGPEAFTGRVIAIDASMCLYQFLIMIRESHSGAYSNLTNAEGQVTSHIVGFLSRTIRLMEAGIKPVYVFDGKPPDLKLGELVARAARREKAGEALEAAKEAGDAEEVLKATKMGVKVTKEQNEQTKQLLRLMGVPVIEAPSEAEATCAALCRAGKVYAAATEDADCLTFGTKLLIRNLLAAEAQKKTIFEINLEVALEQLGVTMDQFIDFCILCGCDYADTIKGIGPTTAMKLVMQHGCLEKVLENLDTSKTPVPPGFRYQAAREFFRECESVDPAGVDLQWREPDLPGMRKFLIDENSFSEERTLRFFDRLKAAKSKTKQQPLTMFFGAPKPVVRECDKYDPSKKRSAAAPKGGAKAKAKAKAVAGLAASEAAAAAKPEEEQVASAPEEALEKPPAKPQGAKARARRPAEAAGRALKRTRTA